MRDGTILRCPGPNQYAQVLLAALMALSATLLAHCRAYRSVACKQVAQGHDVHHLMYLTSAGGNREGAAASCSAAGLVGCITGRL